MIFLWNFFNCSKPRDFKRALRFGHSSRCDCLVLSVTLYETTFGKAEFQLRPTFWLKLKG